MNSAHYDKMKELFLRTRVGSQQGRGSNSLSSVKPIIFGGDRKAGWLGEFHDCLFACLMRYEALQVKFCSLRFDFDTDEKNNYETVNRNF